MPFRTPGYNPYTYGTNIVGIGPLGLPSYTYNAYRMAENMAAKNDADEWWNSRWNPPKKKKRVGESVTIEGEGQYGVDLPGGGRVDVDVRKEKPAPIPPQRKLTLEERRKRGADSWGYLTEQEGALLLPDEVRGPIDRERTPYEYKALGDAAFSMFTGPEPHKGPRLRKLGPGQVRVPNTIGTDGLAHIEARNLAKEAARLAGVSPADVPNYVSMMEPGGKWITYGTSDDLLNRAAGKKTTGNVARKAKKRVDYMEYLKNKNRRRRGGRSRRYR